MREREIESERGRSNMREEDDGGGGEAFDPIQQKMYFLSIFFRSLSISFDLCSISYDFF